MKSKKQNIYLYVLFLNYSRGKVLDSMYVNIMPTM